MNATILGEKMFKQGEMCSWNPGVEGIKDHPVKVCGVATTGVPILGLTYIVEVLKPIENLNYTHVAAFECHLRSLSLPQSMPTILPIF